MDNSLLAVRDINHKYIVVGGMKGEDFKCFSTYRRIFCYIRCRVGIMGG